MSYKLFSLFFKNNCKKIGLVTIATSEEIIEKLLQSAEQDPSTAVVIDITSRTFSCEKIDLINEPFELDDFSQYRLLNGLDDIGITLTHEEEISEYEKQRKVFN